MKIYVASSWRNTRQQTIVEMLRGLGYEVYDFREPVPKEHGFSWREIDNNWQNWTPEDIVKNLCHPIAEAGYKRDWDAMQAADVGVMVMPCGRSAHIEAGYFVGAAKPLFILMSEGEPELMYKMADKCCLTFFELCVELNKLVEAKGD